MVALTAVVLFVLVAWPLLLVALPPLQDLPNHVASAHIIAHPELYPEYVFNGLFKSNSLLTLWLYVFGGAGLYGAARAFTAVVLAANAVALPVFVLRFAGRHGFAAGILLGWPLVHGFFLAMGMLNFSFGFALSLILMVVIDRQREHATWSRGVGMALLSAGLWYAHPFPLMVVMGLVGLHALRCPTWPRRLKTGVVLLAPLLPVGLLFFAAAQQHLVKADPGRPTSEAWFAYLPPWETLAHVWLDASGALTRWGSVTAVPAVLLVYYAWKQRRAVQTFFSPLAMASLAGAYLALPTMISNWWYLNCRLVPFLWAGALVRLPERLPRRLSIVLGACALWFSATLGVDYLRLDRDRAELAAGIAVVPERATLLPLLFKHSATSDFTASLTHAWADYVIAKNTSAPLVFAVERSYPITYRDFPPAALIPPALDRLAETQGTPAQVCKRNRDRSEGEQACVAEWRRLWSAFWQKAEPRFGHVLTWDMPPEAQPMMPATYRQVLSSGRLQVFERTNAEKSAPRQ